MQRARRADEVFMAVLMRQLNDQGRVVGESHPKAVLTDAEVERMRRLREVDRMATRDLAQMFEVGLRTVQDIVGYRTRAQTVARLIEPSKRPRVKARM